MLKLHTLYLFFISLINTMLLLLILLCGQSRILSCLCVFSHMSLEVPLNSHLDKSIKQSPFN